MRADPYSWWKNATKLAEANPGSWWKKCNLPFHENHPEPGRYRMRVTQSRPMGQGKAPTGPFLPVAIWWQPQINADGEIVGDDKLVMVYGFMDAMQKLEGDDVAKRWTHCMRHPISEDRYKAALRDGRWDDDVPEEIKPAAGSVVGHNQPPADQSLEMLAEQIRSLEATSQSYRVHGIVSDDGEKRAAALRARANELSREADKLRDAEKRPHLTVCQEIDHKWQPLVKAAKAIGEGIRAAMGDYSTERANAAREAAEAARKAAEAGRPTEVPTPPPAAVKGAYGRATTYKARTVVDTVTDWDALYTALKGSEELQTTMRDLAQRMLNSGITPPGITTKTIQVAA